MQILPGCATTPIFPYFTELEEQGAFTVHLGDFVTTEDGTGIVHILRRDSEKMTTSF